MINSLLVKLRFIPCGFPFILPTLDNTVGENDIGAPKCNHIVFEELFCTSTSNKKTPYDHPSDLFFLQYCNINISFFSIYSKSNNWSNPEKKQNKDTKIKLKNIKSNDFKEILEKSPIFDE